MNIFNAPDLSSEVMGGVYDEIDTKTLKIENQRSSDSNPLY